MYLDEPAAVRHVEGEARGAGLRCAQVREQALHMWLLQC